MLRAVTLLKLDERTVPRSAPGESNCYCIADASEQPWEARAAVRHAHGLGTTSSNIAVQLRHRTQSHPLDDEQRNFFQKPASKTCIVGYELPQRPQRPLTGIMMQCDWFSCTLKVTLRSGTDVDRSHARCSGVVCAPKVTLTPGTPEQQSFHAS